MRTHFFAWKSLGGLLCLHLPEASLTYLASTLQWFKAIYRWTCGGHLAQLFAEFFFKRVNTRRCHFMHDIHRDAESVLHTGSLKNSWKFELWWLCSTLSCVIAADQPAAINFPGMQEFWFAVLKDSIIPRLHWNSLIMQSVHFTLQCTAHGMPPV